MCRPSEGCGNCPHGTTAQRKTTKINSMSYGYYQRFNKNYASITTPMEKLLKRMEEFIWTEDCQAAMNKLKERLVSAPILIYLDWNKMFHVHIDMSGIALGAVLTQPGEKNMDHLVYYDSRKLSIAKRNYTTIEREALAMVYSLQKFRNYLLGTPFKLFTDHSMLKYLENKPIPEGRIC